MREVQSLFRAPGKEKGAQGVVLTDGGDTLLTRTYEGNDEQVGVYDVRDGSAARALVGHTDVVTALALDGGTLASASADGTARVWQLRSGTCFAIATVGEAVCSIALCGSHLVAGDMARRASLWRLDDRGEAAEPRRGPSELAMLGGVEHEGMVYAVGTLHGIACSVGWHQTDLKLWRAPPATPLALALPAAAGHAMVVGGSCVYVGLRDGRIAGYEVDGGQPRHCFAANAAGHEVTCLDVREDGGDVTVVAGCEAACMGIRVILLPRPEPGSPRPQPVLLANHDPCHAVISVALSPSGGRIAAAGDDEELDVWAPAGGEALIPRWNPEADALGDVETKGIEFAIDGSGGRIVW